ncbi:hypothetical protein V1511DRAFT_107483 [Dipodascopsis uninucleata]
MAAPSAAALIVILLVIMFIVSYHFHRKRRQNNSHVLGTQLTSNDNEISSPQYPPPVWRTFGRRSESNQNILIFPMRNAHSSYRSDSNHYRNYRNQSRAHSGGTVLPVYEEEFQASGLPTYDEAIGISSSPITTIDQSDSEPFNSNCCSLTRNSRNSTNEGCSALSTTNIESVTEPHRAHISV